MSTDTDRRFRCTECDSVFDGHELVDTGRSTVCPGCGMTTWEDGGLVQRTS